MITLYTYPKSAACDKEKEFLDQCGISYQEKNIKRSAALMKEVGQKTESYGALGVPTIDVDGIIVFGYAPEELHDALIKKGYLLQ